MVILPQPSRKNADGRMPDAAGHFGPCGGRYVAETLMPAILELEEASRRVAPDPGFQKELARLLRDFAGRQFIIARHSLIYYYFVMWFCDSGTSYQGK